MAEVGLPDPRLLAGGERVLVVCLDSLGFSLGTNEAIYGALREGVASSAGLMVPAPWARGAAAAYRGEDIGVELTLNADLDLYRWGPITHAPSLLDGDGGFPRTVSDVWEHADLDEVRREWRAQVERAIYWGFDVSHLAAHLSAITERPEFLDVYLDLAEDFRLPVRLPSAQDEDRLGFPVRQLARERKVLAPERSVNAETLLGYDEASLCEWLSNLPHGVTELSVRPCLDCPELRAAMPKRWAERVAQHHLVAKDGPLARALAAVQVPVVGYRALRALMRSEA
jgi:predicted glycoside hydrolase/deacetylase ChbG (UPF0249 family)